MKPINHIHLDRRALLAICLGLALNTCQSSETKPHRMSTDSATSTASVPASSASSVQSVCLGRFVIDLPAGFVRTGDGMYKFDFITIPKPEPTSLADFDKRLDQLEERLKSTKHKKDPSLLLGSASPDVHSRIHMYWEEKFSAGVVNVDGYKWSAGQQFTLKREIGESKRDIGIGLLRLPLQHLRPRPEADIPSDPGFCFNGGFIAEEKWKVEEVLAGFDLAQHPDVHISIHFYPLAKNAQDKPLLDRVDSGVMKMAKLFSSMHTLRKGQRTLDAPFVTIEMSSANPDDDGNPRQASLTDAQALQLWDSMVSTFRLRPTSAAPAKHSEAPQPVVPRVPLGEMAVTGRTCVQTGWWASIDEHLPFKGSPTRFIQQGEVMPRVAILGKPSIWQRLQGQTPVSGVVTVWKLVGYEAPDTSDDTDAQASDAAPSKDA